MSASLTLFNVRVGKDVELKRIGNKEMASFSVADTKKVKGEKVTTWYNVLYYNTKIADLIGKGTMVSIVGDPSFKVYNGKIDASLFASNVEIATYKQGDAAEPTGEVDDSFPT